MAIYMDLTFQGFTFRSLTQLYSPFIVIHVFLRYNSFDVLIYLVENANLLWALVQANRLFLHQS